jgi:hypothetical protein
LSFSSVSFVIPEGNLRLHAACHPAAFRLSFRSTSFVIPEGNLRLHAACHFAAPGLSFRSTWLVIPQRFVCHSAAQRRNLHLLLSSLPNTTRHFDRSRTSFIVLRSGETPVFKDSQTTRQKLPHEIPRDLRTP